MFARFWVLTVILMCFVSVQTAPAADSDDESISFNQDIRPILSDNCFFCHGPDEKERQADVRLDVPGGVDLAELISRIESSDPDVVMPPQESNKQLSADQIDALKRWVDAGAPYQQHWSFSPPKKVDPPHAGDEVWSESEIDRFVLAKLKRRGWTPSAPADKRTLIRRVTLDLTGLPPTLEEIHAFLDDDSPLAYERVVDGLLESPHYGEHMARYWLDLVRFADTNGLHHDHYREMTPYRDWVIRSFNENLPYDQFTIAQIAGDLYQEPSTDQLIASGFNRLHLIIDRGTALPEESFTRNVVDRVSSVGTAFLGLTLECAVCHDHKYDPITQRDFYQLFAFFNNFDGEPETGKRQGLDFKRGLQPPYLELPSEFQAAELRRLNQEISELQSGIKALDDQSQALEDDSTAPGQANLSQDRKAELKSLSEQLRQLESSRDILIESIPATLVMKERAEMRPAHILVRGNYDQLGEQVARGTPAFLPSLKAEDAMKTRMDLARWLVDSDNPLTARVAVNRFWQQLFGVGIVKSSEDFGAQGQPPSHPELLDSLTVSFVESGWDVKALIRKIVLSQTYCQSSAAAPDRFLADPENRFLSRGSRYRYDAEVIRDQALAVTGLLSPTLYGKSVKPPQPEGLWKIVAMPNSYPRVFEPDVGEKIYRRSVYSFWKRGLPPPQMTIFDAPTRESCVARRERTNTPLQALVLMNEQQFFHAAMTLAKTLLDRSDLTDAKRVAIAYETITSKVASEPTIQRMTAALEQFRVDYQADVQAAWAMVQHHAPNPQDFAEPKSVSTASAPSDVEATELASMTMLVHSLLNLDATRTRE